MKFITSVLLALAVFGVVIANDNDDICYKNTETPCDCKLKHPCKARFSVTIPDMRNQYNDCEEKGGIIQTECTEDMLACTTVTLDTWYTNQDVSIVNPIQTYFQHPLVI